MTRDGSGFKADKPNNQNKHLLHRERLKERNFVKYKQLEKKDKLGGERLAPYERTNKKQTKMSDHLKFNKFSEDLTPMRALANFFDVATPVDSPDPEDVQSGPVGLITQKYFVTIILIDVFFFSRSRLA